MKKKSNTIKYSMTLDIPETEIRWIICQHCKKRVYGTEVVSKAILPTTGTSATATAYNYIWKSKKK